MYIQCFHREIKVCVHTYVCTVWVIPQRDKGVCTCTVWVIPQRDKGVCTYSDVRVYVHTEIRVYIHTVM